MANKRLEVFPLIPNIETDSLLFIETNESGDWVSHGVEHKNLVRINWLIATTTNVVLIAGQAQMVNTGSNVVSLTLPANPNVNDEVHVGDSAGNFKTNNCTLIRNGQKIMGLSENMLLDINNYIGKFVFIDSARGWRIG